MHEIPLIQATQRFDVRNVSLEGEWPVGEDGDRDAVGANS
jgi:hypothetical protein